MNYNTPEYPGSCRYEEKKELVVGAVIFIPLVFFLCAGVNAVFPDDKTLIHRIFDGAASFGSLALAVLCGKSMRRKFDDKCAAWDRYWDDFQSEKEALEKELKLTTNEQRREELEKEIAKAQQHYDDNFFWVL